MEKAIVERIKPSMRHGSLKLIGIPFGVQHLKLAALALAPIGKTIVDR